MTLLNSTSLPNLDRRELLLGAAALAGAFSTKGLAATGPKKGGVFRIGVLSGDIAETLDPLGLSGSLGQMVQMMVRNALVEILPNGELGPELAESWEPDASLTKWTFNLRKGVSFHDGRPFSSADAIYSINRHRSKDSRSPLRSVLDGVVDVRADGPNKLIIELSAPNADIAFVFADYAMRIVPDGTTEFQKGIGTGPYILGEFNPAVKATGKRNPNYFRSDRAHFDSVSIQVIPDESARIAALRTGVIDTMDRISYKILPIIQSLPGIKIVDVPGLQHFSFSMLCDRAPFDNNDLRLAMKYGLDRAAILKLVLNNRGYVGNDQPIARTAKYFNTELPQVSYDPERAQYHLKKADAVGKTFELFVSEAAFAGSVDMGSLYAESASKAGLKISITRAPEDGYWTKTWQKVPWFSVYWSGRPTADWMLTSNYAKGSPYNETHWVDDRFNDLLVAARGEKNDAHRRQLYWDMQEILHKTGGAVIPVFGNYVTLASDKVGYDTVSPMWKLDGYKATERWWFL